MCAFIACVLSLAAFLSICLLSHGIIGEILPKRFILFYFVRNLMKSRWQGMHKYYQISQSDYVFFHLFSACGMTSHNSMRMRCVCVCVCWGSGVQEAVNWGFSQSISPLPSSLEDSVPDLYHPSPCLFSPRLLYCLPNLLPGSLSCATWQGKSGASISGQGVGGWVVGGGSDIHLFSNRLQMTCEAIGSVCR